MYSPSPRKTLLLLWGIAVVVLIGGVLLARQEKQIRSERNHDALRNFAAAAQAQLQRLEDLYEDRLALLGQQATPDSKQTGRTADETMGILQVSLLYPSRLGLQDDHTLVNASPDGPPPLPTFSLKASPAAFAGSMVLLDERRLFNRASGWIDEPGKPLMFYVKRIPTEMSVIVVSRPVVAEVVQQWFRRWAAASFEPIRLSGGPDQLRSGDEILATVGQAQTETPDLLLPLRSRFGSFELASWDTRKTLVYYQPATLAVTIALAGIIALLGGFVFLTQRRDFARAAQRVSFVNGVSHELRTPLTNILLNIDLAIEMAVEEPEESTRRLALVRIEARRLGRLIENVLTFSRTEEGKMEINSRACIPAEIISSVIDQFTASFQRRGLTIQQVDENTQSACLFDADALAQIVGNLLSNVEKYVPSGVVEISTRIEAGELILRITDQGPGIPAEAAELIFRPFERIHSAVNEGASGTGLGLAIARDLAHRLGGTLSLQPTPPGSGSCFELRIPAPSAS
jgi:signal transduction histidine kinase